MRYLVGFLLSLAIGWNAPSALAALPDLGEAQARIWYLGHSGWAIQTPSHLLIFDYRASHNPGEARSLATGHIDPAEIQDQSVVVFISHGHGDHWNPAILEWRKTLTDVTYVFGWNADRGPDHVYCEFRRQTMNLGDLTVRTIVHDFDGIPEAAFVVELDGLTIFHSGDHGNGPPPFREHFVDNLRHVAAIAPRIDLAFLPLWGEESFVVETLKPRYTFPMHALHREQDYQAFAARAKEEKLPTRVVAAEAPGDRFLLAGGEVKKAADRH